ncbi:hypothetical protein [Cytobacillus dafuensis]|uniref:Uncharacterized protein n=1 Tax=Cytobacillus dafuensis TaxID=1742359 RepID=A0A5B8Z873_CYTDA|nr:hypothetical protein [Cytobacillus dafuensis]QED49081.1 hypothetical protein FSZ17_18510 [Cytobacillus dafuensis]
MSENFNIREQAILGQVEKMIEHSIDKRINDLSNTVSAKLTNENGNASIKQSGNGIVYVDNTGIAYAFILFYQHFMKTTENKDDMNGLLEKLEKLIEDNRSTFKDYISNFKKE